MSWGAGSMGDTKTIHTETKICRAGPELAPMAGEISPNIMFFDGRQKVSQMGAIRCKWLFMGVHGCVSSEASKNKSKRTTNG